MKDGGLRTIFRHQFSTFQWTTVETAGSASGVPDSEFCTPDGIQGWVEYKSTSVFYVQVKPFQVAWLMRRCRMGGNAWIAVRRTPKAQKFVGEDELWLMSGNQADALFHYGLKGVRAWCWSGGPSTWNFGEVEQIIKNKFQK
jgi:hypothetical protein